MLGKLWEQLEHHTTSQRDTGYLKKLMAILWKNYCMESAKEAVARQFYGHVKTSGKAGAQIPHLPLGHDSSPWGEIMQYAGNLTRFTRLCVTSHSQPLINKKYKIPSNKLIVNNN
jgi:hypothetical protein